MTEDVGGSAFGGFSSQNEIRVVAPTTSSMSVIRTDNLTVMKVSVPVCIWSLKKGTLFAEIRLLKSFPCGNWPDYRPKFQAIISQNSIKSQSNCLLPIFTHVAAND
jgi:hypothetical protein